MTGSKPLGPNPGIKLGSPELQADSLLSEPPGKPEVIRTKSLIALEKAGRNQRIQNAALEDDTRLECKTEAGEASYSKDCGAVLFIIMVHRQPASLPLEMFMKMHPRPAPSRARTLEAGERWARLAPGRSSLSAGALRYRAWAQS